MALSSPAVAANQWASYPSSSFLPASPSIASLSSHQFPAPTQFPPTLFHRRGIHCPALRVTAYHACPDTLTTSLPAPATTLYQVLHVPQTATQAEIKAAYRRLARLYHPDTHTAVAEEGKKEYSTKLFLHIHSAYSALSDAQSRAKYDIQLSAQAMRAGIGSPASVGYSYPKPTASPSYSPCTRLGRSWETDQCWC